LELWTYNLPLRHNSLRRRGIIRRHRAGMLLDLDNVKGKCLAFGVVIFIGKYEHIWLTYLCYTRLWDKLYLNYHEIL
jgi:hypothetical protein